MLSGDSAVSQLNNGHCFVEPLPFDQVSCAALIWTLLKKTNLFCICFTLAFYTDCLHWFLLILTLKLNFIACKVDAVGKQVRQLCGNKF